MIINHSRKFVFIHIPKTAGTTVTSNLSSLTRYCDQEIGGTGLGEAAQAWFTQRFGLRKHSRAEDVMNVMGTETFQAYFKFAFVRNPYKRLASAYHFLRTWDGLPERYREKILKYPDFESFLESNLWTSSAQDRGPDSIFQPQVVWLFSAGSTEKNLVDYVGRAESIHDDLIRIMSIVGGQGPSAIGHANKSPSYSLPKRWRSSWVEKIQREYKQDFDCFSYSLDPPEDELQ